jgi:hypothetical protein
VKKWVGLLFIISLFILTGCDTSSDDVLVSDDSLNTITIQLSPLMTYFLGLNNDLTIDQFNSFSNIEAVREEDEDILITLNNDIKVTSLVTASGSRGGFAVGGFNPAIVFTGETDDDTAPLGVAALSDVNNIKSAHEERGKLVITIDKETEFEFRLAASGSRGGFAMGGFNPAIVFTGETEDDSMTKEAFETLEQIDQVFVNTDNSTTVLFDPSMRCYMTLAASGSRGGFAMGGFNPAIVSNNSEDDDESLDLDAIASQEGVRSASLNDNNQLEIVIEDGINFRFSASGSRGGFGVGGFTPAIVFDDSSEEDEQDAVSESLFKDSPGIQSIDIHEDGSSTVKIDSNYQEQLANLFHNELTNFLDEINSFSLDMEYEIDYEQDLSRIELIVFQERVSRHELMNDYYTNMYQTLEYYQRLYMLFNEQDVSYQFVVKHEDTIFYNTALAEAVSAYSTD